MPRRVRLPGADEIFGPASESDDAQVEPADDAADSSQDSGSGPASGRVRHNEKMTVYLTSAELLAVEQARLQLRADLGRNIDRGRLVRAALSIALADVDTHGSQSQIGQILNEQ